MLRFPERSIRSRGTNRLKTLPVGIEVADLEQGRLGSVELFSGARGGSTALPPRYRNMPVQVCVITAFSAVPKKGAGSTHDMIKIGIGIRGYRALALFPGVPKQTSSS